jgi:signal transduction histidine kinase
MVEHIPARQRPLNDLPVDPRRHQGASPSPSPVAPRRLNLLADLAGLLAAAPEAPETLQAITETTCTGTVSAAAELRVDIGKDRLVFHAGDGRPATGRKLSVRLRAGNVTVGELIVWREKPYHDADRLFLETAAVHLGGALDNARLRRAERHAGETAEPAQEHRSPLSRLRSLFGGAVERAAPAAAAGPDEKRLTSLTDDLVTLARVETSDEVAERIAISSWLRRLVVRRLDRAEAAGRALLLAETGEGLAVQGLPQHLEAAVDHLIANALAYSPLGSAVTVSAERVKTEICIHVDDEGPGIGHAERDRIYERFFRGRAAVAADLPGNGLGLAIVSEVAAAHGGRTWHGPSPTGGSRFTLALPVG